MPTEDDDALVYDSIKTNLDGKASSVVGEVVMKGQSPHKDLNPSNSKNEASFLCALVNRYHYNKILDKALSATVADDAWRINSSTEERPTYVDRARIEEAVPAVGSSGYELHRKCSPFENHISSVGIGHVHESNIDIADSSMETIDLSDKGKLDESTLKIKCPSPFSCRPRRHRSYKKIIQDAFASRKRLIKESEQLGILYGIGDINMDSSQHLKQTMLLSTNSISLEKMHSPAEDICDSEWEII